jgi:hypothetical protein
MGRSVMEGVDEGSWSVFAEKVVQERDKAREETERLREAFELIAEYGVSDVRNFAKKVVSGLTASQALAQMIQENMRSRTREFNGKAETNE